MSSGASEPGAGRACCGIGNEIARCPRSLVTRQTGSEPPAIHTPGSPSASPSWTRVWRMLATICETKAPDSGSVAAVTGMAWLKVPA